jgi:isopentenyl diphosphate isomerase/L-lactate dehydrogenase-like FMN-dependent dehydrogenase
MLLALEDGGQHALRALIDGWIEQLRGVMFLTGSQTIGALQKSRLIHSERFSPRS